MLLETTPPPHWQYYWAYVALVIGCLLLGVIVGFSKIHPQIKSRLLVLLWVNGILGLLLWWVRLLQIPIIGMDLWRFLQELGIVIWILWIVFYVRRHYPKIKLKEQTIAYREKYLPKKKN